MLEKVVFQIGLAIFGLFLAKTFIPGVEFIGTIDQFLFASLILGFVNFYIKPILKKISFPIRLLTFGLFGFIINLGIIWFLDIFFEELKIIGILPLLFTTILMSALNLIFSKK